MKTSISNLHLSGHDWFYPNILNLGTFITFIFSHTTFLSNSNQWIHAMNGNEGNEKTNRERTEGCRKSTNKIISYILLWILIMKPEEKVDIITKSLQWVKYCLDFDKNTPMSLQAADWWSHWCFIYINLQGSLHHLLIQEILVNHTKVSKWLCPILIICQTSGTPEPIVLLH